MKPFGSFTGQPFRAPRFFLVTGKAFLASRAQEALLLNAGVLHPYQLGSTDKASWWQLQAVKASYTSGMGGS